MRPSSRCPSPTTGVASAKTCDSATVAAARAAIDAQCSCDTASNHGAYVSCVAHAASQLAVSGALPNQCKGDVIRYAANSKCGKPRAVTCCRVDSRGKVKCSIKSQLSQCKPPKGGQACEGTTASCCDSCGAGSAGGSFVCESTTTTTGAPCGSANDASNTVLIERCLPVRGKALFSLGPLCVMSRSRP